MERSEYQEFMDCYNEIEAIYRLAITVAVAFEYIKGHRASGAPLTDEEAEEAAREIEFRLDTMRFEINTKALIAWAEAGIKRRYGQSDEEAAEDGGFSVTHFDNST